MPRKKMASSALQEPTIVEPTAIIESAQPAQPEPPALLLPDLEAIASQLLAASEQGLEALSNLKVELILQYDTPETLPENSIIEQVWQSMSPDQRALISSRCNTHRAKERSARKSLHQLTADLEDFGELIDSIEGEEITPELEVAVQQLLEQQEETYDQWLTKIDNYCAAITNRHALVKQRKAESERLAKLAAADASRIDWMKAQLKKCLESQNVKNLSLPRFHLTINKNGGVLPMKVTCKPEELPIQFQRIEVSPDNGAIRKALELGDSEAMQVAQFGERDTHLRVR